MRKTTFFLIFLVSFLSISSIVSAQFKFVPLDIISNFFNQFLKIFGVTSTTSQKTIPSSGAIVYPPPGEIQVTINSGEEIGENKLLLGFQLEWAAGSKWLDSSTFRQLSTDANFNLIRFFEHRLHRSGEDGRVCKDNNWDKSTKNCTSWNWEYVDDVVEKIYESGAEPLIVLGFYSFTGSNDRISSVPDNMPINGTTADLPKHAGLPETEHWAAYCKAWVQHFKNRGYPWNQVRYYEIINEPFQYFGSGRWGNTTKINYYMALYNAAARAMREENPDVKLGCDASLDIKVLPIFNSSGEKLDFLSFHKYDNNSLSATDEQIMNAAETDHTKTTVNYYSIVEAREMYKRGRGIDLPVFKTEGNINSAYTDHTDLRTPQMLGAVATALSIKKLVLYNVSYNIYYHYASTPTSEDYGVGMINLTSQRPWYPYFAQKMISTNLDVDDKIVKSTSNSNDISSLAWINNRNLNILLIHKSTEQNVKVSLQGITGQFTYQKIDNTFPFYNAQLQTGKFTAPGTITLNGYTVMLLNKTI